MIGMWDWKKKMTDFFKLNKKKRHLNNKWWFFLKKKHERRWNALTHWVKITLKKTNN